MKLSTIFKIIMFAVIITITALVIFACIYLNFPAWLTIVSIAIIEVCDVLIYNTWTKLIIKAKYHEYKENNEKTDK